LTWQATEKHKFSVYGAHQPRTQDPQAVSATRSFEAAMLSPSKLGRMIQASWKAPFTSRLLAEAAFASPYNSTPENPTVPWITPDTISVTDSGTGLTYRAAPTYWIPYYYQPSAKAAISYVTAAPSAALRPAPGVPRAPEHAALGRCVAPARRVLRPVRRRPAGREGDVQPIPPPGPHAVREPEQSPALQRDRHPRRDRCEW